MGNEGGTKANERGVSGLLCITSGARESRWACYMEHHEETGSRGSRGRKWRDYLEMDQNSLKPFISQFGLLRYFLFICHYLHLIIEANSSPFTELN